MLAGFLLVECTDVPDSADLRERLRDAHRSHILEVAKPKMAGILEDKSGLPKGAILLFEGITEEEVQEIMGADPMFIGGAWEEYTIRPFDCRVWVS